MTDLFSDGKLRVYLLDALPDPSAPTPEQLKAGTEITSLVSDLQITADTEAGPVDLSTPIDLLTRKREITVTLSLRRSPRYARGFRKMLRHFRRWERALERARRRQPHYVRMSAMHTDYARRRRSRGRR